MATDKAPVTVDAEPAPEQEIWLVIYKYADSEKIYAFVAQDRDQAETVHVTGARVRRTVCVKVGSLL